jgi:hypothetical protein
MRRMSYLSHGRQQRERDRDRQREAVWEKERERRLGDRAKTHPRTHPQ